MINKKASTLLYVLILVNIALIMGVVVFNNSITISNNLNVGTNSEEVYRNIYDKGHIAIQSVKKFNSNWSGFTDIISCPTNVTMSGSTYKVTWIHTQMAYKYWTIYCKWTYRGDEFRIYFNIDKTDYDSAYYKWDLVKLKYDTSWWTTSYTLDTSNNIWPSTNVTGWTNKYWSKEYSADNDLSTRYRTYRHFLKYSYVTFTFSSSKNIWRIIIKKKKRTYRKYTDKIKVYFYDDANNLLGSDTVSWYKNKTSIVIDYPNWKTNKTKKIIIESQYSNRWLNMLDVYMYKYVSSWWSTWPKWVWETEFNDSDSTLISFDSQWTWGWDKIDDDMNSDDYRWGSEKDWSNYINYAFGYEDDDVIPRKTFWWNDPVWYKYYNIFWNNYKTDDFIDKNPYNNMGYSKKIWNVWTGYLYLDTYNTSNSWSSVFDLKIIQFDKQAYKKLNTLLPVKSWEWTWINNFVWYIDLTSSWNLVLVPEKTWNEFPFDFKDKDYAIFMTNKNKVWDISYILKWETETGTGIYINPINDSLTWTIDVMANHMLMWGDKNFIWDNFIIVWPK